MRTSSNRAVGYGRVVSSLTAVIIIDYENKEFSQDRMLCVCSSLGRSETVLPELSHMQLQECICFILTGGFCKITRDRDEIFPFKISQSEQIFLHIGHCVV